MENLTNYQKWEPVEGIPQRLYCEGIHDDYEGFRILLRGESLNSPVLRLSFKCVFAYRNLDESYLLKTLDLIKDREIFPLYIVKNSSWIEWLNEESYNMHKNRHIIHYAIITPNDCIDILSEVIPIAEWL